LLVHLLQLLRLGVGRRGRRRVQVLQLRAQVLVLPSKAAKATTKKISFCVCVIAIMIKSSYLKLHYFIRVNVIMIKGLFTQSGMSCRTTLHKK
jgi:hypothetical protein